MEDLNFKSGNPGAVRFGNFINYYKFHPPENRIGLLPTNIWSTILNENRNNYILDIGCNAGDLTIAIYNFLKNTSTSIEFRMLGIDIDPILIERALEQNTSKNITFECSDIMSDSDFTQEYLALKNRNRFDIAFCFSITMWIHLNHGDDGLKLFLKKMAELCNFLVIEPQPWKCYKTAVRRFHLGKSEFPKFKELKIRQNVEEEIERYLVQECDLEKMMETERTEWGRKLLFFKKTF